MHACMHAYAYTASLGRVRLARAAAPRGGAFDQPRAAGLEKTCILGLEAARAAAQEPLAPPEKDAIFRVARAQGRAGAFDRGLPQVAPQIRLGRRGEAQAGRRAQQAALQGTRVFLFLFCCFPS